MSEREETTYLFSNAGDFARFLSKNEDIYKKMKEKIPILANFSVLAKALSKKPCSCSGLQVEEVMKKRRGIFLTFYRKIFTEMSDENLYFIKESILREEENYETISIMNDEELIRKF